jgi:hypothetical protein
VDAKLGNDSRINRLYKAFRELGRVDVSVSPWRCFSFCHKTRSTPRQMIYTNLSAVFIYFDKHEYLIPATKNRLLLRDGELGAF